MSVRENAFNPSLWPAVVIRTLQNIKGVELLVIVHEDGSHTSLHQRLFCCSQRLCDSGNFGPLLSRSPDEEA